MASFATLSATTGYLTLLGQINDRDVDLAKGLDPATTSPTGVAAGYVRFNGANKRWEKYDGAAWQELIAAASDAYNITVTGLRGGNIYGSVTNGGTISGGTIDATTLRRGGSDVWTAATLTNLNQLTNGPGFITSASLSAFALLASPALTGVPTAPTATVDTNTTQLATTAFVLGQSYLKSASAAAAYAALTGAVFTGDITTYRAGAPTTGVIYLGNNAGLRYLYYDGSTYQLSGAELNINSQRALNAGNFNGYAPTLTGGGASGTWGINVSGSAAVATSVSGGSVSATNGAFSGALGVAGAVTSGGTGGQGSVALQNGDGTHTGYVTWTAPNGNRQAYMGYATTSGATDTGALALTCGSFSVNVVGGTPGTIIGNLTGNVTGNVSGSSGSCTGNAATASVASSANAVAWGNVSSKPFNSVSFTTSPATPTGGSSGDIVFVY